MALVPPKMGGIQSEAEKTLWTGGKPLFDWSGLDRSEPRALSACNPNAWRPTSGKYVFVGWNLRSGLSDPSARKFADADPNYLLPAFALNVYNHFVLHGMDSILYVPSKSDPTKMINVVTQSGSLQLAHVEAMQAELSEADKYDAYDRENSTAGRMFLEAQLDPVLLEQLRLRQKFDDGAAVTWMRIKTLVSTTSAEAYTAMRNKLHSLRACDEPGQNVMLYASKVRQICKELEAGNQMRSELVTSMFRALLSVSVEPFRAHFYSQRDKCNTILQEHMSADGDHETMAALQGAGFDFRTLLTDAENYYRSLLGSDEWPPSKNVKDTAVVPSAFVADGLTQQSSGRKCFKCGDPGHLANKCPTLDKDKGEDKTSGKKGKKGKKPRWREQAPQGGAPQTITKGEGVDRKTWHWCTKCRGGKGLWHSHTTANHTPRVPNGPEVNAAAWSGDGGGTLLQQYDL